MCVINSELPRDPRISSFEVLVNKTLCESASKFCIERDFFERIKSDDPGAVMDIVCDEQQNIQIIFLQTSEMRWTLMKYPALLFIDSTYKINAGKMPLFCFMTVDGICCGVQ